MIKILLGGIVIVLLVILVFGLLIVAGLAKGARKLMGRGRGDFSSRSYGHHHYKKHKRSSMSFFSS
ncbi:hypothetical protein AM501_23125 [Aneurinibacillus migulanus]|uniref:hypothetical protein n=1 Tax=Aneurinibacillus migulanus TaxID=47500 RepID=UPI0005BA9DD1|nr:hypothetical protein [Aneurinibacillus migulanus]KIV55103.1 hypothetical protein TS64_12595 [Aneurinibacillus migulanus]KPD06125.1 hypothetical protein AM501_23125 [Aneurinibacillus migulanus]